MIKNNRCKDELWTFFCVHSKYICAAIFLDPTRLVTKQSAFKYKGNPRGFAIAVYIYMLYSLSYFCVSLIE